MPASRASRPKLLLIDDRPDDIELVASNLRESSSVVLKHPQDVVASDLKRASVVLVDFRLTEWPQREALGVLGLQPLDGLALIEVMRSRERLSSGDEEHPHTPPRAFAIHSAQTAQIAGSSAVPLGLHNLARAVNVEWIFNKTDQTGNPTFYEQVVSLAKGIHRLPKAWPPDPPTAARTVGLLLSLRKGKSWQRRARAEVDASRPPAHAWSDATDGMAFARWLLHGVLPYPCFLWDVRYLAARLRVDPKSLDRALRARGKAWEALEEVRYKGIFSDFKGPRWWRAGVEHLIWEWTGGKPFSADRLRASVDARLSARLRRTPHPHPVVLVDQHYQPSDVLIDVSDAVELRPDYWPTYAEQAWVARSTAVEDPDLLALVSQDDLPDSAEAP